MGAKVDHIELTAIRGQGQGHRVLSYLKGSSDLFLGGGINDGDTMRATIHHIGQAHSLLLGQSCATEGYRRRIRLRGRLTRGRAEDQGALKQLGCARAEAHSEGLTLAGG
jgi:hypothetical protein